MFLLAPLLDLSFNPLILGAFLSGMYLLLFVQALWKLFQRRAYVTYICALVLLWMSIMSSLVISWDFVHNAFVVNNSSPVSIVAELARRVSHVESLPKIVASVVSDGIIVAILRFIRSEIRSFKLTQIWRCYVLWRTTWSLAILIPLLLGSLACNLYLAAGLVANTSILLAGLSQALSAATTLCATLLIVLKIILITRKSRARYSYSGIIGILVQSAALASFVQLFNFIVSTALVQNLASNTASISSGFVLMQLNAYASSCEVAVVGIAPTLIAFRVADDSEKPRVETNGTSRTSPLSRLAFRRSDRRTGTESEGELTRVTATISGPENEPSTRALSGAALDNMLGTSGQDKNIQAEYHLTRPEP